MDHSAPGPTIPAEGALLPSGHVMTPQSQDPDRIRSNADVGSFELDPADVAAVDALGAGSDR